MLSAGLRFSISGAILFTVYFFQIKCTEHKSDHHNLQQYQEQQQQKHPQYQREHNNSPQLVHPLTQELITKQQWKYGLVLGLKHCI